MMAFCRERPVDDGEARVTILRILLLLAALLVLWKLLKRRGVRFGGLGLRGRVRRGPGADPDRVVYRRSILHPMAGLVLMLLGLAAAAWRPSAMAAWVICAVCVGLGAVALLLRSGLVVDRGLVLARRWWGLGVPMLYGRPRRAPFEQVMITGERRAVFFFFWNVCEVSLTLTGEPSQVIETDCSHDRAWLLGEELARLLDVPLADYAGGREALYVPAELNASLRQRVARGRVELTLPEEPRRARSEQQIDEEVLHVRVPAGGVWLRRLYAFVLAVVAPTAVLFATGRLTGLVEGGHAVLLPAIYAVTLAMGIGSLPRAPWRGWQVEASGEELAVTARGLWRSRTVRMPVADVLHLDVMNARAVEPLWYPSWFARTRYAVCVTGREEHAWFGRGLRREELEWLRASVQVALNA